MDNEKIDGSIKVVVDEKYMWAKIYKVPALNGGVEPTLQTAKTELQKCGVCFGIDWAAVESFVTSSTSDSIICAVGVEAIDGEKGSVTYTHEATSELKPKIDPETGMADYRELGRVVNIKQGELIANIKIATQGTEGIDVRNIKVKPYPGQPAKYILGQGTVLSNDGTKIFAANDGNLRWDRDRFVVDTVVSIGGNVDVSVGNIDFVGDVVIKGSVAEGFIVKGKNITVSENVTGATLIASGNIESRAGFVFANIEAQGDVKVSFAENATIKTKGGITAKSLVNCDITAEQEIVVSGGKGVIVGGNIICYSDITATQVGSDAYAKTNINLGNTPVIIQERNELMQKYTEENTKYEKMKTVYETLTALKKQAGSLDADREGILRQAFRYVISEKPKIVRLSEQLKNYDRLIDRARSLKLHVKSRVFPGTNVKIFTSVYDTPSECGCCTFSIAQDGDISMRAGL